MKVIILILNFVKIIGVFPRLIKLSNVIPVAQNIDHYFLCLLFAWEIALEKIFHNWATWPRLRSEVTFLCSDSLWMALIHVEQKRGLFSCSKSSYRERGFMKDTWVKIIFSNNRQRCNASFGKTSRGINSTTKRVGS